MATQRPLSSYSKLSHEEIKEEKERLFRQASDVGPWQRTKDALKGGGWALLAGIPAALITGGGLIVRNARNIARKVLGDAQGVIEKMAKNQQEIPQTAQEMFEAFKDAKIDLSKVTVKDILPSKTAVFGAGAVVALGVGIPMYLWHHHRSQKRAEAETERQIKWLDRIDKERMPAPAITTGLEAPATGASIA